MHVSITNYVIELGKPQVNYTNAITDRLKCDKTSYFFERKIYHSCSSAMNI